MSNPIQTPAQLSAQTPYLSVVATSRNDNHGGGLLLRMQLFINGLAEQCRQFQLPTELILVEWNPPADKPKLTEALIWPEDNPYLTSRVLEVSHTLHMRLEHAARLPLYQMIAKNVGIRRARGEFVLATNIDLLFEDGLIERIARRDLEAGRMYRADRYDTDAQLTVEMPQGEQLALCRENLIRIFRPDEWEFPRETPRSEANPSVPAPAWRQTFNRWTQIATRFATLARLYPKRRRNKKHWHLHRALLAADFGNVRPYEQWQELYQNYPVHTAACGDFTMLAYDDWIKLTGYAEFEMYSMHIDSLFCLCANAAGIKEVCWPEAMYHLEHEGGWAPEPDKETRLFSSLQKRTIPVLTNDDVIEHHITMHKTRKPLFFNKETWGLRDEVLPETVYRAHESLHETAR